MLNKSFVTISLKTCVPNSDSPWARLSFLNTFNSYSLLQSLVTLLSYLLTFIFLVCFTLHTIKGLFLMFLS